MNKKSHKGKKHVKIIIRAKRIYLTVTFAMQKADKGVLKDLLKKPYKSPPS